MKRLRKKIVRRFSDGDILPKALVHSKKKRVRYVNYLKTILYGLSLWFALILIFSIILYFVSDQSSYLIKTGDGTRVVSFFEYFYFSVVTGTSTGYGDIVPVGYLRAFAIIEIMLGLTVLAVLTSRIVYLKQEQVLEEIHSISHREEINKIRYSMLLFRQDLNILKDQILHTGLHKSDQIRFSSLMANFDYTLYDLIAIAKDHESNIFGEEVMDFEIVLNGVMKNIDHITGLKDELKKEDYSTLMGKNRERFATITGNLELIGQAFSGWEIKEKDLLKSLREKTQSLKDALR